jgi:ABC-type uncharacterized transport system substrate-binding protein
MRAPALASLAFAALGLAAPAAAHPHVFVDAGVDFVLGASGKVERIRVTWVYDDLFSLYLLQELGVDPAAPPGEAARAAIVKDQSDWHPEFSGDSFVTAGGEAVPLSRPLNVTGDVVNNRVVTSHERTLGTPVDPRAVEVVAEIYDPVYFVAYAVVGPTRVEGPGAEACSAALIPFQATDGLVALQNELLTLGLDQTPEDQTVGRLFAERVRLTCG